MSCKAKVILQARTGSKRLYGKVLLPISKHELVVLCWKRIKLSNLDVIVAIPRNKEDDYLAEVLKNNKIKFFRGDTNNVFSRFKKITSKMRPDDIIIRVTADNPIVDGFFIKRLLNEFKEKNYNYLSAHDNLIYTPYGLQAEIFKAKHLREKFPQNKSNLEHVTPAIRKRYLTKNKFEIKKLKKFKNLRITIDDLNDFQRVSDIFKASSYNEKKNYLELLKNYKKKQKQFNKIKKNSNLVLGTVQLGKKYYANTSISQNRANKILKLAYKKGINFLDTAYDYGKAEKFIGNFSLKKQNFFSISTKLRNFKLNKNLKEKNIQSEINKSIFKSLKNLRTCSLDTYLIHNSNILFNSIFVYEHIKRFINCGIIKNFGVSIYTPKEFYMLKKYKKINCVQLPFNILDYKWKKILNTRNKKLKIFIRSIFLRGRLKQKNIEFSNNKSKYKKLIHDLNILVKKFNKKNLIDMTVAYVKSFKGINHYVFGVQNQSNLISILNYFKTKSLKENEKNQIIRTVKKYFNAKDADLRSWN